MVMAAAVTVAAVMVAPPPPPPLVPLVTKFMSGQFVICLGVLLCGRSLTNRLLIPHVAI